MRYMFSSTSQTSKQAHSSLSKFCASFSMAVDSVPKGTLNRWNTAKTSIAWNWIYFFILDHSLLICASPDAAIALPGTGILPICCCSEFWREVLLLSTETRAWSWFGNWNDTCNSLQDLNASCSSDAVSCTVYPQQTIANGGMGE